MNRASSQSVNLARSSEGSAGKSLCVFPSRFLSACISDSATRNWQLSAKLGLLTSANVRRTILLTGRAGVKGTNAPLTKRHIGGVTWLRKL